MRIVAFAYACEPGRGSESAAGWMWVQMLARLGETWVITRANNKSSIERVQPPPNVHFVYVDLPPALRRWKRGQRGIRVYYLLWQRWALKEARRLHRAQTFSVAWHLTFANAWLGSVAGLLGPPMVYGPVGAGVGPPWRLSAALGLRGILYEVLRTIAGTVGRYLNPLARVSWRRAQLILVQNEATRSWLPARHRRKAYVFPNAVADRAPGAPDLRFAEPTSRVMLFAGRLLPLKGVSLAIRTLEWLTEWRLVVCGDGSDYRRLHRSARKRGFADRVDFRGWVDREELLRIMREEASVFVFPSFHDQSPWVVVEAMTAGLPIVCIDRGGSPLLAGDAGLVVEARGGVNDVSRALALAMRGDALPSTHAALARARQFAFEARLDSLRRVLEGAGIPDSEEEELAALPR